MSFYTSFYALNIQDLKNATESETEDNESADADLLETIPHENIDDSHTHQAYWDLIEAMADDVDVPQDLTDLLSYITEGRRISDGERFHRTSNNDVITGYWTSEEVAHLHNILETIKNKSFGELDGVIKTLSKIVSTAIQKDKDILFISA